MKSSDMVRYRCVYCVCVQKVIYLHNNGRGGIKQNPPKCRVGRKRTNAARPGLAASLTHHPSPMSPTPYPFSDTCPSGRKGITESHSSPRKHALFCQTLGRGSRWVARNPGRIHRVAYQLCEFPIAYYLKVLQ